MTESPDRRPYVLSHHKRWGWTIQRQGSSKRIHSYWGGNWKGQAWIDARIRAFELGHRDQVPVIAIETFRPDKDDWTSQIFTPLPEGS